MTQKKSFLFLHIADLTRKPSTKPVLLENLTRIIWANTIGLVYGTK